MSTTRGSLSVTIPAGSTLDLGLASCNIGSFTNFINSASVSPQQLPSYADMALFRVQTGTGAWTSDPNAPQYPNGSYGILTSGGDPKPVVMPGAAKDLRLAAVGGAAIVNILLYQAHELNV